jgi:DNA-binding MarR family transcriptional regulator
VLSKESHKDAIMSGSDYCEDAPPYSSDSLKNEVIQELREEIRDMKDELFFLRDELIKNRERIRALENKKKSPGKEVKKRVASMILLIRDYGGSMTSSSIKTYMGLSKDEFYRSIKCAKDEGLIEVLPDPNDRRGYILRIRPDISTNFSQNLV